MHVPPPLSIPYIYANELKYWVHIESTYSVCEFYIGVTHPTCSIYITCDFRFCQVLFLKILQIWRNYCNTIMSHPILVL